MIGGPAATPINRIELYIDVMVPRSFFSTPSVMRASKLGRPAPIPIPQIKNIVIIYHSLIDNHKAAMDKAEARIPPTVIHFIKTLFFFIIFPVMKDDKHNAPRGKARKNPFLMSLIPYSLSNNSER